MLFDCSSPDPSWISCRVRRTYPRFLISRLPCPDHLHSCVTSHTLSFTLCRLSTSDITCLMGVSLTEAGSPSPSGGSLTSWFEQQFSSTGSGLETAVCHLRRIFITDDAGRRMPT
eukprot:Blabericola_migrator_1__10762@NODE_6175_length_585_cov_20_615830_g4151_i0_p1_GENE_NODE_6175_length_585_cov_20_615830_g4151_i0NODE_6175_length_585_cov_20_615830_g4151_i0_p1_ORF_typecomplete_len115_score4_43CLN3/PF02487_17/0_13AHD/PF17793_1/0_21_NODE_6175_length_585_cov_20_615830_g4151_i0178522